MYLTASPPSWSLVGQSVAWVGGPSVVVFNMNVEYNALRRGDRRRGGRPSCTPKQIKDVAVDVSRLLLESIMVIMNESDNSMWQLRYAIREELRQPTTSYSTHR